MSVYKIIDSKVGVEELIHNCQITKYASIDFETSGLEFQLDTQYPLILGTSFQPGSSHILPLQHFDSPFKKTWKKMFRMFSKEVIENPEITKIAWNLKFEKKWLIRMGSLLRGRLFDAQLARYCLNEEKPHDLKSFVAWMFPQYGAYEDEIGKLVTKHKGWANVPLEPLARYCGLDTDLTLRSMIILEPKLIDQGFYNLFRNLLMTLVQVLGEAEYRGEKVDDQYLFKLIDTYKVQIEAAEEKVDNNQAVIRFKNRRKKSITKSFIKKETQEIQMLHAGEMGANPGTRARMIAAREKKIKNYLEGKFNAKEEKKLTFNLKSPDQLVDFFYKSNYGLNLPIIKYTKDKKTKQDTKRPSTDEETLEKLKAKDKTGFIPVLLTHRGLVKLDSTYISGMAPLLDHCHRLHPSFKIFGTVTGRLSCAEPNMQNIPRGSTAADIKTMFIPPYGYVFVEVDYSQAELRVIAELAEDKAMIEIFRKNYNIHVATACKMNGGIELYEKVKGILKKAEALPAKELELPQNKELLFWMKQKKKGKSLNFSIVYQQGPDQTAEQLECTKQEAIEFQEEWFRQFPEVARWIKNQKKLVARKGYVTNLFGRKRRLDDIWDDRKGMRSKAERDAVNAPVQGTGSDFTSFSQVVIREQIREAKIFPADMFEIITVHDSIKYAVRPWDVHKVVPKLVEICDNPQTEKYFGFKLRHVKMKVSAEVGIDNWANLKDYDDWTDYEKLYNDHRKKLDDMVTI